MVSVREFLGGVSVECVKNGSLGAAPPEWLDAVALICERQEIASVEVLAQAKPVDFDADTAITSGKRAFLLKCVSEAQKLRPSASASSEAGRHTGCAPASLRASCQAIAHVNLADEIAKQPAINGLPQSFWPRRVRCVDTPRGRLPPWRISSKMADWLASEIRKLEKRGTKNPFVFTDMKKWIPAWLVPGGAHDADDEPEASKEVRDLARALGAAPTSDPKKGLFITSWAIAWQRRRIVSPSLQMQSRRALAGTEWLRWRSASCHRTGCCSTRKWSWRWPARHRLAADTLARARRVRAPFFRRKSGASISR